MLGSVGEHTLLTLASVAAASLTASPTLTLSAAAAAAAASLQAPGALILLADLDEYLVTSSPMTVKQVSEVKGGMGVARWFPRLSCAAAKT